MVNKAVLRQSLRLKIQQNMSALPTVSKQLLLNFKILWSKINLNNKFTMVAGYYPDSNEVDILPILQWLISEKVEILLPQIVTNTKKLNFITWDLQTEMIAGKFNLKQPKTGIGKTPECIIAPLLGFDHKGNRLGRGGGYYDYTLYDLQKVNPNLYVVGAGFSWQEVDEIQAEAFDIKLNAVVTEQGYKIFKD